MDSKVGSHWSFRNKRDISSSLGSGRGQSKREGEGGEVIAFWKVVQHRDERCSFVSNKVWFGSYLEKAKLLKISGPRIAQMLNCYNTLRDVSW